MKTKCKINEIGRECSKCWQFKEWNLFANDKSNKYWYTCNCLECRNKMKKEYRKSYMWKIKDNNYKIIKRADPNYRKQEYKKHNEYVQKNKDKLKEKNRYKDNKKEVQKRKIREYNYYLKDEKVIYNWNVCRILKDYNKKEWILININWIRIFVRKYKVKPYKEKPLTFN